MSLYKTYRPQNLEEFVGNKEVIISLEGLFSKPKDFPHATLLSGPTGCGKTTIARIISKQLESKKFDLIELDTADFRGIETIRNLIRQSQHHSLYGGNRVWILDECHKLTNEAQNALLKLLEDPPNHAYFILCTTNPSKLLKTVKGRCLHYELTPLDERHMRRLLRLIVKAEGKNIAEEIYEQIIKSAEGLPRNAIQILEKVLSVPEEQQLSHAKQTEKAIAQSIDLCRQLIQRKNWQTISTTLKGLKNQDPEGVRRHVLGYCQTILLSKEDDQAALIMEIFSEPFYNTLYPGLVLACYTVHRAR